MEVIIIDEYKILNLPLSDFEKVLNQWKHEYKIFIIAFGKDEKGNFYGLIKRIKKGG